LDKAENKRAAIIAQQAERQQLARPEAGPPPKRKLNWAATAPVRPRRGRPPTGGDRK
jgi:hypothetical protein